MRVLAIGLGGAGSRIVDQLYEHDCRSRVSCMKALAVDLDPNSLQQLRHLPAESRMFFPPIDPHHPYDIDHAVHVEEVMTRVQHIDTIQIDAILICCGMGGSTVHAVPRIIQELRKAFIEPVFLVATLPTRSEGMRRSAKAYSDIQRLRDQVDALILFDNELLAQKVSTTQEEAKEGSRTPLPYPRIKGMKKILPENPRDTYLLMNERIARYIGLLLRAGEFNERGLEVAEVVLDAGEVLKTLTHMGIVAVGYAVEELEPTGWLSRFRTHTPSMESTHAKAARIVSLAKRAVYEESSISCDLTSAEKALVLIAGPSHELSMRGFQTVRKWIDRSITGIEMRSGDYPVKNTRYIGIIIVLAGLKNVPRIEELHTFYERCREDERSAAALPEVISIDEGEPATPTIGTSPISIEVPFLGEESPSRSTEADRDAGGVSAPSNSRRSSREKEPEDLSREIKKPAPKKRGRRKKDDDFGLTWFK
jgi:cell division GTPase FtsZ